MTVRDIARAKATNKNWTWTATDLMDTYFRPVTGWKNPLKSTGAPAWDEIANWKPHEIIQVVYNIAGDPVSARFLTNDQAALNNGRWVGVIDSATGNASQKATKVGNWLDKQAI